MSPNFLHSSVPSLPWDTQFPRVQLVARFTNSSHVYDFLAGQQKSAECVIRAASDVSRSFRNDDDAKRLELPIFKSALGGELCTSNYHPQSDLPVP